MYLPTIRRYCCEHINFTDIFCIIIYVTLADKKLVPGWLKLAHGGIRRKPCVTWRCPCRLPIFIIILPWGMDNIYWPRSVFAFNNM